MQACFECSETILNYRARKLVARLGKKQFHQRLKNANRIDNESEGNDRTKQQAAADFENIFVRSFFESLHSKRYSIVVL